jgi:hypothetical protein
MDMPDSDDRRKYMNFCRHSFDKMKRGDYNDGPESCRVTDFGDWKILVKLLLVAGFVNFHSDDFEHDIVNSRPHSNRFFSRTGGWKIETKCGRICSLGLFGFTISFPISQCILHLDRLEHLELGTWNNFQFVPLDTLSMLPRLKMLRFSGPGKFHIGDGRQYEGLKLPGLKVLSIFSLLSFEMLRRFTGLKQCNLGFSKESESEIERYFDILRSPDSRLAETLEVINCW